MNPSPKIIQVVPWLGSDTDGVAQYAMVLGAELTQRQNADSWFLCGDPAYRSVGSDLQNRTIQVRAQRSGMLLEALQEFVATNGGAGALAILVHYSNYGYAKRGCPFWLVDGLEQWRRSHPEIHLVTFFHEFYASGPPWSSSFWISPIQRTLARRLARLSDQTITSSELYREMIAGWIPPNREKVWTYPVFSTIGEPAAIPPLRSRPPRIAVLGRAGTEMRAYGVNREGLARLAHALDVEEIVDIGPRSGPVPKVLDGLRVRSTGRLAATEVSALLSGCRAGFLDYPSDVLGKSTVFAAYCAHGLVPLITRVRRAGLDGLRAGEHFLQISAGDGDSKIPGAVLETISSAAVCWYRKHSVSVQARALMTAVS